MKLTLKPDESRSLCSELQRGQTSTLQRRRALIGASLVGMAAMGAVSLLQTGIVKHLPDPPLQGFDSDKVNSSETAYALGVPDGTLSFASLAANLPLAAWGGADRAETTPLLPIALAGKAIIEAAVASWYFYQMPAKEKAWCGYCIVGAAANLAVAALAIPEAKKALRHLTVSVSPLTFGLDTPCSTAMASTRTSSPDGVVCQMNRCWRSRTLPGIDSHSWRRS